MNEFLVSFQAKWRTLKNFAAHLSLRVREEALPQAAGSLTFTTILSIVPLATLILAIFTAFPIFKEAQLALENYFIENLLPKTVAATVTSYINLFASKARGMSLFGGAFLVISSLVMFFTIERALNLIWDTKPSPHWGKRLIAYWVALTIAPLVLGFSLYMYAQLMAATKGWGVSLSAALKWLFEWLPFLIAGAAWAYMFYRVPNKPVEKSHAVIGAVVATLLLWVLKALLTIYITKYANFKQLYGAFAVIPVLLIWLYLGWLAILFGAVLAASLPQWGAVKALPEVDTQTALKVLKFLLANPQLRSIESIAQAQHLSEKETQAILAHLSAADLI